MEANIPSNKALSTYTVLNVCILSFLLSVSVHFDTKVLAGFLPVQFTVSHVEEVTNPQLVSTRDLDETDSSRAGVQLGHPVRQDISIGRPFKIPK